jgi:hypothetical protein
MQLSKNTLTIVFVLVVGTAIFLYIRFLFIKFLFRAGDRGSLFDKNSKSEEALRKTINMQLK